MYVPTFTPAPDNYLYIQVPVQPNFCDCGIYLLHFAQTFMSDPDNYCSTIHVRPFHFVCLLRLTVHQRTGADSKYNDGGKTARLGRLWGR